MPQTPAARKAWMKANKERCRQAQLRWAARHPERVREQRRAAYLRGKERDPSRNFRRNLSRYGLTREAWEAMLIAQSGLCDACGSQMTGPREPFVDHCHDSDAVRGLLCHGCNSAYGLLREGRAAIVGLLAYHDRHAKGT